MLTKKEVSDFFYSMRGIAIISVAFAHSLSLNNVIYQRIGAVIGLIGVPVFIFCSGFWFKHDTFANLIKKLSNSIVIPWMFWGVFAFMVSYILGSEELNIKSFFLFILGHGTWLYYIPVYILLKLLFNISSNTFLLFLLIAVSLLSNFLSYYSSFYINDIFLTPWQNPLNWVGFFSLGILVRRFKFFNLLLNQNKGIKIIILIISVLLSLMLVLASHKINYWNPIAIILEYFIIFSILIVTSLIYKNKVLILLGCNSLLIYFLHMQLGIGFANILYKYIEIPEFFILLTKPFVVLSITYLLICVLRHLFMMFRWNRLLPMLGIFNK